MPSPEPALWPGARQTLLEIARRSIESGLSGAGRCAVDPDEYAPELCEPRGAFVTVRVGGALRGCLGSVEARQTLVEEIAESAFGAAFRDPRFPPLRRDECARLELHVSVLGPPRPLHVATREQLIAALQPLVDGLVLRQGPLRATFLPAVWTSLPDPSAFVRELERKACFPPDVWLQPVECSRYTVEEWSG